MLPALRAGHPGCIINTQASASIAAHYASVITERVGCIDILMQAASDKTLQSIRSLS